MDWRAVSRSRSRMSVDLDWRAASTSRSRSRPPTFEPPAATGRAFDSHTGPDSGVQLGLGPRASPFTRASMGGNVNDFVAQQAVLAAEAEMGLGRFGFGTSAGSGGAMGLGMGLGTIVDGDGEGEGGESATGEEGDEVDKYLKLGSEHATSPGIRIPARAGADEDGYVYPFEGSTASGTLHGHSLSHPNSHANSHSGYAHLSSVPFHPSSLPSHGFYGFPPGQMHNTWTPSSGGGMLHAGGGQAGHGGHGGHGIPFGSPFGLASNAGAGSGPSLTLTPAQSLTPSQSVSLTPAHSLTPSQSLQSLTLNVSTSQAASAQQSSSSHPHHPLTPPHAIGPPNFQFPRRVRKTSFDHTVSKEGIGMGIGMGVGRHQVNGRPSWVGTPSTLVSGIFYLPGGWG